MTRFETVPCRGCGRPIVWATTSDGKRIPLDPRPPVYDVHVTVDGKVVAVRSNGEGRADIGRESMVSHFATCPKAAEFSGSGKKKEVGR